MLWPINWSIWGWLSGVTADNSSYIAQTVKWSVQIPQTACRSCELLVRSIQGLQCSSLGKYCIWDPIYQSAIACQLECLLHHWHKIYLLLHWKNVSIACPDNWHDFANVICEIAEAFRIAKAFGRSLNETQVFARCIERTNTIPKQNIQMSKRRIHAERALQIWYAETEGARESNSW